MNTPEPLVAPVTPAETLPCLGASDDQLAQWEARQQHAADAQCARSAAWLRYVERTERAQHAHLIALPDDKEHLQRVSESARSVLRDAGMCMELEHTQMEASRDDVLAVRAMFAPRIDAPRVWREQLDLAYAQMAEMHVRDVHLSVLAASGIPNAHAEALELRLMHAEDTVASIREQRTGNDAPNHLHRAKRAEKQLAAVKRELRSLKASHAAAMQTLADLTRST